MTKILKVQKFGEFNYITFLKGIYFIEYKVLLELQIQY